MNFSKKLIKLREEKKLTQDNLAEKLNVPKMKIARWEKGTNEPTLSELKDLAKVFNYDISDLVDDKKKSTKEMKEVKEKKEFISTNLDDKDSKNLKKLSKAIVIISKISNVALYIVVFFIMLGMIVIPSIISRVKVNYNTLTFTTINGDELVVRGTNLALNGDYVIEYKGEAISGEFNLDIMRHIENVFTNNSQGKIIFYLEFSLFTTLLSIVCLALIFKNLTNFFKNIYNGQVFTINNNLYLKRIAYFIVGIIVCNIITVYTMESLIRMSFNSGVNITTIVIALSVLSLSYLIKYGCNLEKNSEGKIYK